MPQSEQGDTVRLTRYSHGAGCGCKIAPRILEQILAGSGPQHRDPHLWVGNASRDDAAVYAIDDTRGVVSTTDFFMPIVDDPFDFGRIAAANAISDIYAMGGRPLVAIAILGWPVNVLGPEVAREVVRGGRSICDEATIPLAGGHSIDAPEPIFGLAVTGLVDKPSLKRNDTATTGCRLYLTKPLGTGALLSALKKGVLTDGRFLQDAVASMTTLNGPLRTCRCCSSPRCRTARIRWPWPRGSSRGAGPRCSRTPTVGCWNGDAAR